MPLIWTYHKAFKLIEHGGEEGILDKLEGAMRNKHIYEKLSVTLPKAEVKESREQCTRLRSCVSNIRRSRISIS